MSNDKISNMGTATLGNLSTKLTSAFEITNDLLGIPTTRKATLDVVSQWLCQTGGLNSQPIALGAITAVGAATFSSTVAITGAVTSGTINGQTISATAALTGTLSVAGAVTLSSTFAQSAPAVTDLQLILNADATNAVNIRFRSATIEKWLISRDASNQFVVYNSALGVNNFTLAPSGAAALSGTLSVTSGATAGSATAITAGGSLLGLMVSSTANFGFFVGSGAPTISAAKGSYYARSDGSSTITRGYINTDGGTTWTAITTVI